MRSAAAPRRTPKAAERDAAASLARAAGVQPSATRSTPQDVDSHGLPLNAKSRFTSSATHQPRSWSKAEA